ncbi:hypothetical protein A2U01_0085991, partial [Trifolium medium]|nr:hypothetical protein [Trifolium medium]
GGVLVAVLPFFVASAAAPTVDLCFLCGGVSRSVHGVFGSRGASPVVVVTYGYVSGRRWF